MVRLINNRLTKSRKIFFKTHLSFIFTDQAASPTVRNSHLEGKGLERERALFWLQFEHWEVFLNPPVLLFKLMMSSWPLAQDISKTKPWPVSFNNNETAILIDCSPSLMMINDWWWWRPVSEEEGWRRRKQRLPSVRVRPAVRSGRPVDSAQFLPINITIV